MGNLTVTAGNAESFPPVDEFYGHLTIEKGATLLAPRLAMVRGWVTVAGSLHAPLLGQVNGWLTLLDGATLNAIHLLDVTQDMVIGALTHIESPALAGAGSLALLRNTSARLPSLMATRDNLTLSEGAHLVAPALERIGRSLTLREGAKLDAFSLNHIGGFYDGDPGAQLVAPRFLS